MKTRFTLTLFTEDMGSFKQPGCTDLIDALWHINSAREHDNLPSMDEETLRRLIQRGAYLGWAKLTPE